MRHLHRIAAALSLLLLLTPAPPLAAQVDEDEYAETPADLTELLGPKGVDELSNRVFWTAVEPSGDTRISLFECEATESEIVWRIQF